MSFSAPERISLEWLQNPVELLNASREIGIPPRTIAAVCMEHVERYRFARRILGTDHPSILDIACGEGYGARILKPRSYSGADYNEGVVKEASKKYKGSFLAASALKLPFRSNYFDALISFETIEHLGLSQVRQEPNQAERLLLIQDTATRFLQEAHRVVRPGGMIIVSSPNRDWSNPGTSITDSPRNHHHAFETSLQEFTELVNNVFPDHDMYVQGVPHQYGGPLGGAYWKIAPPILYLTGRKWRIEPFKKNHDCESNRLPAYLIAICRK